MTFRLSTESLARSSARRPWTIIAIWIVAVVVSIGLAATLLADALTFEFKLQSSVESVVAEKLLEDRLSGPRKSNEIVIFRSDTLTVDDLVFRQKVEDTFTSIAALGKKIVEGGVHYYLTGDESLVSADRHTTILPLVMAGDVATAGKNISKVHDLVSAANNQSDFEVLLTGQATVALDAQEISKADSESGESIAIPLAVVILVLVFGALVAAFMPIIVAAISIPISLGLVGLVGLVYEFSLFVTNIITLIGLAVGIDYALFIVHRYREGRSQGLDKTEAIGRAGATAGRAVFFSGTTVVLALAGLLIMPMNVFNSLAIGAIFVVAISVLASLTLLPALLGLLGDKVDRLHIPIIGYAQKRFDEESRGGFWDHVSHAVMKYPVVSLLLAAGLMAAATIPFFDIKTGLVGVASFPDNVESKKGFVIVSQEFPNLLTDRAMVVIDGDINDPSIQDAIEDLRARMEADGHFGKTQLEPNAAGDLALLSAPITGGDASSDAALSAIRRLRGTYIPEAFGNTPADVRVAGDTAFFIDFFRVNRRYTPIAFAFVLSMSFVLVTVVFRSIVVAVKAIILNLLSVGAAYGLIVLVFQKGVGNELLGLQKADAVEAWLPLFLFAILFGLSMDYHIFLLSRIRERFDQTQENAGSVAFGIRSTGRLITGAAVIMVAVFGGFAFSARLVDLQEMGFGLGSAILLDATIVRMVLVPSAMKLMGKWNWYLPGWLQWLPDFRPEAKRTEPARASAHPQ